MMNPEPAAAKLGITVKELFERAYQRYGLVLSPASCASDIAWYRKWSTIPVYVKKFIVAEKRKDAPLITQ